MFRAPETSVAGPAVTRNNRVPILFLKTKSSPTDAYEDLFKAQPLAGAHFEPWFVPVLRHSFKDEGMSRLDAALRGREVSSEPGAPYGGMIFTSQRAVEAFAALVERGKGDTAWPHLQDVPIYSVGPATTRALRAIPQDPPLQVFGEASGTGEVLSGFMLEHYRAWYEDRETLPPLLFLVGETRRDVIPKRLMDESLPASRRVGVDEVEMYETGVMESFPADLERVLAQSRTEGLLWIVVFSPAGCEAMLRGAGLLDDRGEVTGDGEKGTPQILVATIGPTTRDCLAGFGFTPHVCAEKPSPEGVLGGIALYMNALVAM